MLFKPIHKVLHLLMRHVPCNAVRVSILKLLGANIQGKITISQEFFVFDAGRTDLLFIGDGVGIGPRVTIVINSDPYPSPLQKIYPKKTQPVNIRKGVWIGAGAIVLPGVTIGEFSVVAAGTVVVKDIPPYSVAAGVPARVVRKFSVEEINELEG